MGVTPPTTTQNGFTLLEIMVAMALIGLMLIGIGAIQQRESNTQNHLENQLAAAQVASNLMERFLADGLPVTPEQSSGKEEMANRLFVWNQTITPIDEGKGYAVRIQVGMNQDPLFMESMQWAIH